MIRSYWRVEVWFNSRGD